MHADCMCVCVCGCVSSQTEAKLAGPIHLSVNQPAAHHNDQSLKEEGDKDNH